MPETVISESLFETILRRQRVRDREREIRRNAEELPRLPDEESPERCEMGMVIDDTDEFDEFLDWYSQAGQEVEQSPENTLIDRMNNNPRPDMDWELSWDDIRRYREIIMRERDNRNPLSIPYSFILSSNGAYSNEFEDELNELIKDDKKMLEPRYCWFCNKTLKKKHVILIDDKFKNRLRLTICPECKHTYEFFVEKIYHGNREKTIDAILTHTRTYPLPDFKLTKAQLKTDYKNCVCCHKEHMRTYSTLILDNIGQYKLCKDCEYEYKFLLEKTKTQMLITTKGIFDRVKDCTNVGGLTKCLE